MRSPLGVSRKGVPVRGFPARPGTEFPEARRARGAPATYFVAGLALFCFGFFGVLAFLSTDASCAG